MVAKDFKDQFIGINIKLKVSIKIRQINIDGFSNQVFFGVNRLFALVHSNHGENSRRLKAWRYYLLKIIINNYNVIINGKIFCTQSINSYIKRYEKIRKN